MQAKLFYNKLTKTQEKVATGEKQHKFGVCPETGIHLADDAETNDIRMEVAGIEGFKCLKLAGRRLHFRYHGLLFPSLQPSDPKSQETSKVAKLKSRFLKFIFGELRFFWYLEFGFWNLSLWSLIPGIGKPRQLAS